MIGKFIEIIFAIIIITIVAPIGAMLSLIGE
jgi:hypothetical protein